MSLNIVVTGANGQLGSEIKDCEPIQGCTMHYTDIDTLNLCEREKVFSFLKLVQADYIINCAAYTAVDKAEEDIENANRVNATVPKILAEYCETSKCRLIHISTDYVFDGKGNTPLKESDQTNPQSAYGKSKLLGEQAIAHKDFAMIIRTSWLYSAYGSNFVKSMLRLLNEKTSLSVVYDQTGSPTYARDLALAIMNVIQNKKTKFAAGIYHYSNEGVCSWFDFAKEISEIAELNCELKAIESKDYPLPAPRPHYSVLSKNKIKETFDVKVPYWRDSLKECIFKLKKNQ